MSDCQDYPTVQTIQAFGKDAPCLTEIVTSNADRTTATASDGQTKKTIAAALREAGWVSVGEWSTNPTITEPNEYVFYNNQRFAPLTLPYPVDSATNPDPNSLVPSELREVSKFATEDDITTGQTQVLNTSIYPTSGDISNGAVIPTGTTSLKYAGSIIEWWQRQSVLLLRFVALITLAFGAIVVYCA